MELEEFYKQVGGNFEDVKRRLFNEEYKDCRLTQILYKYENLSAENNKLDMEYIKEQWKTVFIWSILKKNYIKLRVQM